MSNNDIMEDIANNAHRSKRVRIDTEEPAAAIPATIKSCNECRQQKLKCDVVKEPFQTCSRCRRLKISCKIDSDFKRIAKRNKHAETEHEIRDLKQKLAATEAKLAAFAGQAPSGQNPGEVYPSPMTTEQSKGQELGDISLSGERLAVIFEQFFAHYHPLCQVLDPEQSVDHYFNLSPFLGWTIVMTSSRRYCQDPDLLFKLISPYKQLLWATVSEMPQRYHTVKALSLLCMFPIPLVIDLSKKTRAERLVGGLGLSEMDPTFMLGGIMMQIALQTGLHRTLHAQDFFKQRREVTEAEIKDRKLTWALCNIVCQNVNVTSGQPSRTIYDWSLGIGLSQSLDRLPVDVEQHLKIQQFCDKFTKKLYSDSSDLAGLIPESGQETALAALRMDLQDLESLASAFTRINQLNLLAAKLHFSSFAFFIPRHSPSYFSSLTVCYDAAKTFIQAMLDYDLHSNISQYCPEYITRTLISATCVLLKVLNSSLAIHFDIAQGKALFSSSVLALRAASLKANDFADRLAEILTRMWKAASVGNPTKVTGDNRAEALDLKIRSRMSFSHVYDCIWGWRRSVQQQNSGAVCASTAPLLTEKEPGFTHPNIELMLDNHLMPSMADDFDFFDALNWIVDDNTFY